MGAESQPSRSGPEGPRPAGNAEKALEPTLSRPGLEARKPHDARRGRGGLWARDNASVPVRTTRLGYSPVHQPRCYTPYAIVDVPTSTSQVGQEINVEP